MKRSTAQVSEEGEEVEFLLSGGEESYEPGAVGESERNFEYVREPLNDVDSSAPTEANPKHARFIWALIFGFLILWAFYVSMATLYSCVSGERRAEKVAGEETTGEDREPSPDLDGEEGDEEALSLADSLADGRPVLISKPPPPKTKRKRNRDVQSQSEREKRLRAIEETFEKRPVRKVRRSGNSRGRSVRSPELKGQRPKGIGEAAAREEGLARF